MLADTEAKTLDLRERAEKSLAGESIAGSISTVGDALDNALMESTIGQYKTELLKRRGPWRTLTDGELGTAEWIDWYNNRRPHGEIGHVPPVEYETEFYLTLPNRQLEPQPQVWTNARRLTSHRSDSGRQRARLLAGGSSGHNAAANDVLRSLSDDVVSVGTIALS